LVIDPKESHSNILLNLEDNLFKSYNPKIFTAGDLVRTNL
jgi:hypothetical protein